MKKNTIAISKSMKDDHKRWQAEDDARTLASAMAIKADKARVSAASGAAKKMLDEQRERTAGLAKIAKLK